MALKLSTKAGSVIKALMPMSPNKTGEVITPKIPKRIANGPRNIWNRNRPIIPIMMAMGERINENINRPTMPIISPIVPVPNSVVSDISISF
jgi:hypothetical protein